MIIVRSPLRITLGGGGTDLPSYYSRHGGYVISAAIDKYVYVGVMRAFTPGITLKYSEQEHAPRAEEIRHPIFRETLKAHGDPDPHLEITTLADIPAGTGLGSSSSFATALIAALFAHRGMRTQPAELAERACEIEIDRLGDPIGKQDQYIAAYGGITQFWFSPNGSVRVEPLGIARETLWDLEDNLLLFFTGYSRSAGAILKDQVDRTAANDPAVLGSLHHAGILATRTAEALRRGNPQAYGEILHEHWMHKRQRSPGMTNAQIDEWYAVAKKSGAIGGKLVGAGGGGFLLFYAEDRARLRQAMGAAGLEEVRFRFDFEGTKVILA